MQIVAPAAGQHFRGHVRVQIGNPIRVASVIGPKRRQAILGINLIDHFALHVGAIPIEIRRDHAAAAA